MKRILKTSLQLGFLKRSEFECVYVTLLCYINDYGIHKQCITYMYVFLIHFIIHLISNRKNQSFI